MSPAPLIPATSISLQSANNGTSNTSVFGANISSGFKPSSIASTDLPVASNSGHETSFPIEGPMGLYAMMICTMPDEAQEPPAFPKIHIGPGRPLATVFEEETGKPLPPGCTIAVPTQELKKALAPLTEGATVFVHKPFATQTSSSEPNEHMWRDISLGLGRTILAYVGVGVLGYACFTLCCIYPIHRRLRGKPGGPSDREEASQYELEDLTANSGDGQSGEEQVVADALTGPLPRYDVDNRTSVSEDSFGDFKGASAPTMENGASAETRQ
jgi:hypothetical protein